MDRKDFHVHSTFSDGKDSPEEIVRQAIKMGLKTIGFSDHSYTFFDTSYCIPKAKIETYRAEIAALKEKYQERIEILCGIEQDYYSEEPTDGYDYVIGSVHYVKAGDTYIEIDNKAEVLKDAADRFFDGDIYALTERYFETVANVVPKTGATLIGHFDPITKFQEKTPLFDENHPRYIAAWKAAADKLLQTGVPFEINTGAISRGYRTTPYPSPMILDYLKQNGAAFVLSSDSHRAETLCFGFEMFS